MTTRSVPYDGEMEYAALGNLLTSRRARALTLEMLTSADFYNPEHAVVFAAAERLHARGAEIDRITLKREVGDAKARIPDDMGYGYAWEQYNRVVSDLAECRRYLAWAGDLTDLGYRCDIAALRELAQRLPSAGVPQVEGGVDAIDLAETEWTHDWLVPGLIELRDRVMVVAPPGRGKSLLLRQIAVMLASGIHPFQPQHHVDRVRVLIVDLENSPAQTGRSLRHLRRCAQGRLERGWLTVVNRPQGMDATNRADAAWLRAVVKRHKPSLLVFGSLYKAYRGTETRSKHSEEAADAVTELLDQIRVAHNCALLVEAHSSHDHPHRVRGSKVWEDWPEFGIALENVDNSKPPTVDVIAMRDSRERGRHWPPQLLEGRNWPWEACWPDGNMPDPTGEPPTPSESF